MKEEKTKKIEKNELDDSEIDQVAAGGFQVVKHYTCPLCGTECSRNEIEYKTVDGKFIAICTWCAQKL